jgi:hypothetical protein
MNINAFLVNLCLFLILIHLPDTIIIELITKPVVSNVIVTMKQCTYYRILFGGMKK